jgi:hypothetical protein
VPSAASTPARDHGGLCPRACDDAPRVVWPLRAFDRGAPIKLSARDACARGREHGLLSIPDGEALPSGPWPEPNVVRSHPRAEPRDEAGTEPVRPRREPARIISEVRAAASARGASHGAGAAARSSGRGAARGEALVAALRQEQNEPEAEPARRGGAQRIWPRSGRRGATLPHDTSEGSSVAFQASARWSSAPRGDRADHAVELPRGHPARTLFPALPRATAVTKPSEYRPGQPLIEKQRARRSAGLVRVPARGRRGCADGAAWTVSRQRHTGRKVAHAAAKTR